MLRKSVPVRFFVVGEAVPVVDLSEFSFGVESDFYWKVIRVEGGEGGPSGQSADVVCGSCDVW